jgi:hypothetical protein
MAENFVTRAGLVAKKCASGGHVDSGEMIAKQTISHHDKHVFRRLNSVYGFCKFHRGA